VRTAVAATFLAVTLPAAAQGSTRLCQQLEAELAGLSRGGGSSSQATRYDAAIARQQEQMQKARQQARQAGCGMAILRSAVPFCGELNATMARMEKNLVELQGKRAGIGGGDVRRDRARVQAALDVNGCRAPQRSLPEPVGTDGRTQVVIDGRNGLRIGGLSGSFRTLCVRTCDGYYFPMSYSVSSGAFERDQMACRAACPDTQVELYHHRVPGEESEDMVSASTGMSYRELPNAFAYRKPGGSEQPGCGCQATASGERGFQVIGGDYGAQSAPTDDEAAVTAAIPQPSTRPDPGEDPETLSSREGGLHAEALKRIATPPRPTPAAQPDGERQVRVVGPTFLPDPEEAIDLRAPAPNRDQ